MFALSRPPTSTGGWRRTTSPAPGPTPAPCTGPGCSPTTSWPGCSPAWTGWPKRWPSGTFDPGADRRGRARRAGAPADRDRRRRAGRPAAGRAVPQRPDRHADPDVPAGRTAPARRRRARRRAWPVRAGPDAPRGGHAGTHPPAARPAGAAVATTCWPTPGRCCATSTGSGTGPAAGGQPVRLGGAGRDLAGSGPGATSPRELGFARQRGQLDRRHRGPRRGGRGRVRAAPRSASTCPG